MAARSDKSFAIVCDSACDLPLSVLAANDVALAPLHVTFGGHDLRDCLDLTPVDFFVQLSSTGGSVGAHSPSPEEFSLIYRALANQGFRRIISLHASSHMRDSWAYARQAAREIDGVEISVLDTRCFSGQMALVVARLALDRRAGMAADEALERALALAGEARLLLIPAAGLGPARRDIARAFSSLIERMDVIKSRALGTRRLFSLSLEGELVEEGASGDLSRLASAVVERLARREAEVGPLTCVEMTAGVPRQLELLHARIDAGEVDARRAAILNTNPSTTSQLGIGALGLAYVPSSLLSPKEAASVMQGQRAQAQPPKEEL